MGDFNAPDVFLAGLEAPPSDQIEFEACFRRLAFDSGFLDPSARKRRETAAEPSTMQPDSPADVRHGTATREDLMRQFWDRFRRLNEQIHAYLDRGKSPSETRGLEPLLRDVFNRAEDCFLLAALIRGKGAGMSPAQRTCLADLDAFVRSLSRDSLPPEHEVAHALDSLIVQCVRIQTE